MEQSQGNKVKSVFKDFKGRRSGILKAITTDYEKFYKRCDPVKPGLCLIGNPDEEWVVKVPANIGGDIPQPGQGINFLRDRERKTWIYTVALHSDAWLLGVAFYLASKHNFSKAEREQLFNRINDLPTVLEELKAANNAKKRVREGESSSSSAHKDDEDNDVPCSECGKDDLPIGVADRFLKDGKQLWIQCDDCHKWFHCKCVNVNRDTAEATRRYVCQSCRPAKYRISSSKS